MALKVLVDSRISLTIHFTPETLYMKKIGDNLFVQKTFVYNFEIVRNNSYMG